MLSLSLFLSLDLIVGNRCSVTSFPVSIEFIELFIASLRGFFSFFFLEISSFSIFYSKILLEDKEKIRREKKKRKIVVLCKIVVIWEKSVEERKRLFFVISNA